MNAQDQVLVGIDGSDGGRAALRYGAAQAARSGLGLRLMHVWPEGLMPAGTSLTTYPGTHEETQRLGQRLLDEHAELAREMVPGLEVSTLLVRGDLVGSLVRAADQVSLTVLGDERHPLLDRIATGSVLTGVAARAAGAVVAVPSGWDGSVCKEGVVAAVKSCTESAVLVRRAMEIATAQGLPLTLLHAWQLPMIYDEYIAARVGVSAAQHRAEEELEALATSVRGELPDAPPVRVVVHHGQPARAIIDASTRADLVLLARRPHVLPTGHLGGTARAVLRSAHCPVEVLPPAGSPPGLDGLAVEAEGEAIKAADGRSAEVAT